MNNKICIGIFYTFFVWNFEICSTQIPLKKIVDDINNSNGEDVEKLEDYEDEDVDNLENDSKKVDEMDQSNISSYDNDDEDFDKNMETYEDMGDERSKEKQAGDYADLFGTNPHYSIPTNYEDFGRRFVLSYPYFEKNSANTAAESELDNAVKEHMESKKLSDKLVPMKAPPELVLAIAKESALLEAAKPKNPADEVIKKDILRTGDYWDGVWKEDVEIDQILRSSNKDQNKLESFPVEILPGSKLYDLISILIQKSPRLLYVINKYNDE
ncbi:unnamed protein product [Euphydryas editha]|uniref:Uncharacterized protein n=1 Tax=Euphydryas editha TaxID=104508 RepID=A0AAU9UM24_EUPED|nr:unnamed protein product [Euphydryas editha]